MDDEGFGLRPQADAGAERVICPHGCREDAPTLAYLTAHIVNVHGAARDVAEQQAVETFKAGAVAPPKEKPVAKTKTMTCSKCQKPGHNARSCGNAAAVRAVKPSRNGHGHDPILTAIDAKIGTLRAQINALEAAKAALA